MVWHRQLDSRKNVPEKILHENHLQEIVPPASCPHELFLTYNFSFLWKFSSVTKIYVHSVYFLDYK